LLCRSSVVCYILLCSLFLLDVESFDFCLRSCSLYLYVPMYLLLIHGVVSKFQVLH
jgi:hypothetical protein